MSFTTSENDPLSSRTGTSTQDFYVGNGIGRGFEFYDQQVNTLQQELSRICVSLKQVSSREQHYKANNAELSTQVSYLQSALRQYSDLVQALQRGSKEVVQQVEAAFNAVDSVDQQYQQARSQNAELTTKCQHLDSELGKEKKLSSAQAAELTELREEVATSTESSALLQAQVDLLETRLSSALDEEEALRVKHEKEVDDLNSIHKTAIDALSLKVHELEEKLSVCRGRLEVTESMLQSERSTLQKESEKATVTNERFHELSREITRLRAERESQESDFTRCVSELRSELKDVAERERQARLVADEERALRSAVDAKLNAINAQLEESESRCTSRSTRCQERLSHALTATESALDELVNSVGRERGSLNLAQDELSKMVTTEATEGSVSSADLLSIREQEQLLNQLWTTFSTECIRVEDYCHRFTEIRNEIPSADDAATPGAASRIDSRASSCCCAHVQGLLQIACDALNCRNRISGLVLRYCRESQAIQQQLTAKRTAAYVGRLRNRARSRSLAKKTYTTWLQKTNQDRSVDTEAGDSTVVGTPQPADGQPSPSVQPSQAQSSSESEDEADYASMLERLTRFCFLRSRNGKDVLSDAFSRWKAYVGWKKARWRRRSTLTSESQSMNQSMVSSIVGANTTVDVGSPDREVASRDAEPSRGPSSPLIYKTKADASDRVFTTVAAVDGEVHADSAMETVDASVPTRSASTSPFRGMLERNVQGSRGLRASWSPSRGRKGSSSLRSRKGLSSTAPSEMAHRRKGDMLRKQDMRVAVDDMMRSLSRLKSAMSAQSVDHSKHGVVVEPNYPVSRVEKVLGHTVLFKEDRNKGLQWK